MSRSLPPRVVVVVRPTELEGLLLRHGTREQARFFLETRGRTIDEAAERHEMQQTAIHAVGAQIPVAWRRAKVLRAELDRFLFETEDIVIALGQDGLVANVAKYLHGQLVIGVNTAPQLFEGVLVRNPPSAVGDLLAQATSDKLQVTARSMVQASTSDGVSLVALNEIFVGHRTHQSARYTLKIAGKSERQSSSGLIVCTGTGSTGWAKSISLGREGCPSLPTAASPDLSFLVREAWPSVSTGANLTSGILAEGQTLQITSEMNDGGAAFGDGIEDDRIDLPYGQVLTLTRAATTLRLV